MKYQTKPHAVEAFRFTAEVALAALMRERALPFGLSASGSCHPARRELYSACVGLPHKWGEPVTAGLGEWIVKRDDGSITSCTESEFAATYEAVQP